MPRGPEGGGYRPPEEKAGKTKPNEKLPPEETAKVESEKQVPVTKPDGEKENAGSEPRKEFKEYSPAELAVEIRGFLERMNAQTEKDRLNDILKALWEKLGEKEKKTLTRNIGEIFKRLKKGGYPLAAIFESLTETLKLILEAVEKRERK